MRQLFIIPLLVMAFVVCFTVEAYPVYEVEGDILEWRDEYRKKVSLKMFTSQAKGVLLSHASNNKLISNIKKMVEAHKELKAIEELQSALAVIEDTYTTQETLFFIGLTYETLGFYPEAMANYKRIIKSYPNGPFYLKAYRRLVFVSLTKHFKLGTSSDLEKIARRLFRLYEDADKPHEWQEPLAAYAIVLYELDDYSYASEVFQKIGDFMNKSSVYTFIMAENCMQVGCFEKARIIYETIPTKFSDPELLAYLLLRLGDIAVLEGRIDKGQSLYKEMIGVGQPFNSRLTMGTMALAELYMKKEEEVKATDLFKELSEWPLLPDMKKAVFLHLLNFSHKGGRYEDLLFYAKKLLLGRKVGLIVEDIEKLMSNAFDKLVSSAYAEDDYKRIIRIYYENKAIAAKSSDNILIMVGDSLLKIGLTKESIAVYKTVKKEGDRRVSMGLIEANIMNGDVKQVMAILETLSPRNKKEKLQLATVLWRTGDIHFRSGEYDKALKVYKKARGDMNDPEFHLKLALTYRMTGKFGDALTVYRGLLKKGLDADAKAQTLIDLGSVYYSLNRWTEALAAFKKGVDKSDEGDKAWILYKIGHINLVMGNRENAINIWQKVVEKDNGYLGKLAEESIKETGLWALRM